MFQIFIEKLHGVCGPTDSEPGWDSTSYTGDKPSKLTAHVSSAL